MWETIHALPPLSSSSKRQVLFEATGEEIKVEVWSLSSLLRILRRLPPYDGDEQGQYSSTVELACLY